MNKIEEIRVVGVDKAGIEKDDSFPAAYKYPFKLSATPDSTWTNIFEQLYSAFPYSTMQRDAHVSQQDPRFVIQPDRRQLKLKFLLNPEAPTSALEWWPYVVDEQDLLTGDLGQMAAEIFEAYLKARRE